MNCRPLLWVTAWCVVCVGTVRAQIQHIENRRIYSDTVRWAGTTEANFSTLRNRELLVNAELKPFVQYTDSLNYWLLLGNYEYSAGDRVYAHSLMLHTRYNRYLSKRMHWMASEVYAQAQSNPLLGQRIRALMGTGPRFAVLNRKGYRLFSGISYMFEYEQTVDYTNFYNHRGSLYLSWLFDPLKTVTFSGSVYGQPLLTNFADYRVSGQLRLLFRIIRRLGFKFEVGFLYDSRPPVDVRKFIFDAEAGITYDFTRGAKQKKPRR